MSATSGTCTRSTNTKPSSKGGTVTCQAGTLAGGSSVTITIDVTPTTPGKISATASVTASGVTADADDIATTTTTVSDTVANASTSGSTASVPVTCTGATSCAVKLTLTVVETLKDHQIVALTASTASRKNLRVIDLGSITRTIAAGHGTTIKVALNQTGKRLLTSHHKLSVKLTLTQTSRKTRTVARTLTFKAPKTKQ
jgi:hypothetical protein